MGLAHSKSRPVPVEVTLKEHFKASIGRESLCAITAGWVADDLRTCDVCAAEDSPKGTLSQPRAEAVITDSRFHARCPLAPYSLRCGGGGDARAGEQ